MSDSLWPHGLQHARLPCPSLSPRVCSDSCSLSQTLENIKFSLCISLNLYITFANKLNNVKMLYHMRDDLRKPRYHFFSLSFSFFGQTTPACGILAPRPGIKPRSWQWKHRVKNHWTTSGFPRYSSKVSLQLSDEQITESFFSKCH